MTEPVVFIVPGAPRGKGRARFSGKTGTHYTPAATRSYEQTIGRMAGVAMRGKEPFTGPIHIDMRAHFKIPAYWPAAKREAALRGDLRPTSKPDLDNILKSLSDGMQRIVFDDDAAIVSATCSKVYGAGEPFVAVTVKSVAVSVHRVPNNTDTTGRDEHAPLQSLAT